MTPSDKRPGVDEIEVETMFVGYQTWPAVVDDWEGAYTALLDPTSSHPFQRSAWRDPGNSSRVVVIDVTEQDSRELATAALEERFEWDATSQLLPVPGGLGHVSRTQSAGASPATYFVRGNLAMLVMNQGPEPVDTIGAAKKIDTRLVEKPTGGQTIPLSAEPPEPQAGDEVTIRFFSPWDAPDEHYYKFFVEGADVRKNEEGEVVITRGDPGPAQVHLYGVRREGAGLSGSTTVEFLAPPG